MRLTLRIWRQAGPDAPGQFVTHQLDPGIAKVAQDAG